MQTRDDSTSEERQREFVAMKRAARLDRGVLNVSIHNQWEWPWDRQQGSPARGSRTQTPELLIARRGDGKAAFSVAGRQYVSVDSFASINNRADIGDCFVFWFVKRVSADMRRIVFVVDNDGPAPQPTAVFVYEPRAASIPPAGRGRPR